ncbi:hypothetical protein BK004_04070 [bacterium CG10_46_32]|nr:MAG: hypothetical protein BK004_04070 [bacterium CG10_46_32]
MSHIAIIVLHYKNLDDTKACLKSLEKIDYPSYSVIVVNNDADGHGKVLMDEFPKITLIQNESNLGFAEGNNIGMRHALANDATDAVLVLNNDTEVEPSFLTTMAQAKGDMIAGHMMQYNNRDKVDNLGVVMMKSGLPFNRLNEKQKIFCPSAGCALYSRRLLEACVIASGAVAERGNPNVASEHDSKATGNHGDDKIATVGSTLPRNDKWYFDPTYFAYTEDIDLGFRAHLLGFEAGYDKDAVVYHKGSASTSKLSDFAVYTTYRNLIWTQYKNYPTAVFFRNVLWIILGWMTIFFGYIFKDRPWIIAKAMADGLAGIATMKHKRAEIQKHKHYKGWNVWFENGIFPKNLL